MELKKIKMVAGNQEKSVLVLVSNVMENTAAHGIPNIKRAHTPLRRIVWAMLFLFGFTMFGIQAFELITQYLSFEVDINFEIVYEGRTEFPAVTICNMNPIKESFLSKSEDLNELLGRDAAKSPTNGSMNNSSMSVTMMGVGTTTTTQAITTSANNNGRYQDWNNVDYSAEDDDFSNIFAARDIVASLPYDERRESGHELDDMLLECSFNGFPCSPDNFTHFYNYHYGNCFTFNGGDRTEEHFTTKPGPLYGLSMELYVEQDEYIADIQPAAGIRVTVHPRNAMAFPEDNGVSVTPGLETSIGVKRRLAQHVPVPYTNCTPVENLEKISVFKQKFPWVLYNRETCENNCLFYEVLDTCDCTDPRYSYNISDGQACTHNDSVCVDEVEGRYFSGKSVRICACTTPCEATTYEPTVSASKWPNIKYMEEVLEAIENTDELMADYQEDPSFVTDNFVKVLVFYNELNYEHVYDTEKYLWYNLLSDLGGQFGLWVGVSVLTVFEFVELMYDIVFVLLRKFCGISRRNKTGSTDNIQ